MCRERNRWRQSHTFLGPAFYYHLRGQNTKLFFPNSIGIGIVSYSDGLINSDSVFYYRPPQRQLGLSIFCSAGVAYRPARWFSVGLNMHAAFHRTRYSFERFDVFGNYVGEISFVENYFYFGPTLGINFHF
jgi:hypothetical protein